jgi:beta-galactosidase
MQEMGLQVVRMAEFSWHKLEPEDGRFDFTWLDRAIALLGKYGIKTVIGTPSAAPPAWMIAAHPEILPTDREGRTRGFGGRHHDCQSNEVYRAYVRRMVTEEAEHYRDDPNVIGWQIDNELGNSHGDLCHCESCRRAFGKWLQKKYGSVDALNRAWGTAFWSQEYNSFDEIPTPRITVCGENPSQMLDWNCFHSDLILDFASMQAEILRRICPGKFITHNFMGFSELVDYYDLAERLDFVSHDQYPCLPDEFSPSRSEAGAAAALDVVRSFKERSYWIMEQQSGITGWQTMSRAPEPGQLSAWTMQSIAHGADCVVFFRWRVYRYGTEQYWHGILPHSGTPGRRYEELRDCIKSAGPLMDRMQGAVPRAQAGILYSFRQNYAITIQPQHPQLSYTGQLQAWHRALYGQNIPVDFVQGGTVHGDLPHADFSRYRLLIAPLQYLMTPAMEELFTAYVKNGGTLVLTMRTGVKDENNVCMTDRELPGRLSEAAGLEVRDYDCLRGTDVKVTFEGKAYTAVKWADLITPSEDTEVLAEYAGGWYAGTPCITSHRFGKGTCVYVGTEPGPELMEALTAKLCAEAGILPLAKSDRGVELMQKENASGSWLFAINFTGETKHFEVPAGRTMILGSAADTLGPYETQIFEG